MSKLKQCTLTLTRNCNLRCSFCYAKKTKYIENEFLPFADVMKMIDFCDKAKVKYVVLTGGEPTLYDQIVETIRYIKSRKHKMLATITTNGVMLDNQTFCDALVESGLDYIDISLKGWNELSFENVTGCNLFLKQLGAIKKISVKKIDFTCSMVITKYNVGSFCDAIEKAANSGCKQFSFTFAIDNEESDIKNEDYLKKNNPFELIEAFLSKKEKLDNITNGEWWIEYSFPICVYTPEQLAILENKLAAPCQVYYKNGVTFDAKGNLIPCSMNIETKMGKIGKDFCSYEDFRKMSRKKSYKNVIDGLTRLPSNSCKKCEHLKSCLGGCTFFWKHCSYESFERFKKEFYKGQYQNGK